MTTPAEEEIARLGLSNRKFREVKSIPHKPSLRELYTTSDAVVSFLVMN